MSLDVIPSHSFECCLYGFDCMFDCDSIWALLCDALLAISANMTSDGSLLLPVARTHPHQTGPTNEALPQSLPGPHHTESFTRNIWKNLQPLTLSP